jgi:hypothetical protein
MMKAGNTVNISGRQLRINTQGSVTAQALFPSAQRAFGSQNGQIT